MHMHPSIPLLHPEPLPSTVIRWFAPSLRAVTLPDCLLALICASAQLTRQPYPCIQGCAWQQGWSDPLEYAADSQRRTTRS
jgi:hypothetical protein